MMNSIYYSNNLVEAKDTISKNIFLIRKAVGVSHEKLCELTGLTRPILSSIENRSGNPTIETLIKISSALNISIDMLFISRSKFISLKSLLKSSYEIEKQHQVDFLLPERSWKTLLKISGSDDKIIQSKIAKICFEVLKLNYEILEGKFNNIVLGASLGVIFQKDGFKEGLEFGAWLGKNLSEKIE